MRILRCEEGLTLVETIIALVLMLGLMAAFAGAMVVGLQSEVEVDKRLEASNLASGIVEYLGEGENLKDIIGENDSVELYINEQYEIVDGVNTLGPLNEDLFFDDIKLETDSDSSTITINKYNDDIDGLYEVIINIKWLDRGNDWSNELVTLLAVD